MLKLLETNQRPKLDYEMIYLNGIDRTTRNEDHSLDNIRKMIFNTVKFFTVVNIENHNREQLENLFEITRGLNEVMTVITPADLMTIFPIDKNYKGNRDQVKDYYSSMEAVNAHGLHERFKTADEVRKFLWDYCNTDIMEYQITVMCIISAFNKFEFGESLIERWIRETDVDLPVYQQFTDQNGKPYMIRTTPFVKEFPKHIRLLKGVH
ncbi:hypothetical protein Q5O24_09065 [Eubacteriaceae bacterium ES3]|nr:hypothetical protein Q5O24_09065 [Eubacteriaceae bacterium ES3]